MNIVSIGNFEYGWDGSICDEEHIAQALENLGHKVYRWSRQNIADDINNISGAFDFVLISQYDQYPEDLITHLIKRYTDAPVIYWAFDYQADGQEWHERLVADSDLYLSKRIADSKYPNWRWLSQDFAPEFLKPFYDWQTVEYSKKPEKEIDVLFTGSYLHWADERTELLKAIDSRFNLVIHSVTPDQWKEQGLRNVNGPIMDAGLPELYSKAAINISIDHTIEAGYWSDRNAQIMCCGGFVLFKYVPMSEARFGDNIAYFNTEQQMLDKIRYYLDAPQEREALEQRGLEHAQRNLKVTNRVKDLLTIYENSNLRP